MLFPGFFSCLSLWRMREGRNEGCGFFTAGSGESDECSYGDFSVGVREPPYLRQFRQRHGARTSDVPATDKSG